MAVLRIVPHIHGDPAALSDFYRAVFDLDVMMDLGWIRFVAAPARQSVQLGLASAGESGNPAPDISIEVDDLDATLARARSVGAEITYGPVVEDWGVRRFFLRDPAGYLLNVLTHIERD